MTSLYCKLILLFFCGVIRISHLISNNKLFTVGGSWWGLVKRRCGTLGREQYTIARYSNSRIAMVTINVPDYENHRNRVLNSFHPPKKYEGNLQ